MSDLGEVSRKLVAVFAADVEGYSRRYRLFYSSSDNPTFLAGRERISVGLRIAGVPDG